MFVAVALSLPRSLFIWRCDVRRISMASTWGFTLRIVFLFRLIDTPSDCGKKERKKKRVSLVLLSFILFQTNAPSVPPSLLLKVFSRLFVDWRTDGWSIDGVNAVTPIESTLAALRRRQSLWLYRKWEPLSFVVLFYSGILRTRRESLSNGDPIHRRETT